MRTVTASALLYAFAAVASAANFSGKWVIESPGRGGMVQRTTLVLNQVGNEVEGSITPSAMGGDGTPVDTEMVDTKVEGETITFYVWTGRDRPQKTMYKGTLSGEQITFTVTGGPAGMNSSGPRQATAKRCK
jgi:hypothetical protein